MDQSFPNSQARLEVRHFNILFPLYSLFCVCSSLVCKIQPLCLYKQSSPLFVWAVLGPWEQKRMEGLCCQWVCGWCCSTQRVREAWSLTCLQGADSTELHLGSLSRSRRQGEVDLGEAVLCTVALPNSGGSLWCSEGGHTCSALWSIYSGVCVCVCARADIYNHTGSLGEVGGEVGGSRPQWDPVL